MNGPSVGDLTAIQASATSAFEPSREGVIKFNHMVDEGIEMAIPLSLASGDTGGMLFRAQEEEAPRLGLCGAEIDAPRQGHSFDVRTSLALVLPAAAGVGDEERRQRELAKADCLGISFGVCQAIQDLAMQFVAGSKDTARDVRPAS